MQFELSSSQTRALRPDTHSLSCGSIKLLDRLGRYPHHNAIGSRRHYKVHVLVNGKPVALRLALHGTSGPLGQPLKTSIP